MTIKINGTNTTAQPSITGTDTDTGLVYGTDEVSIVTGGTTQATVDSSGRLLVGTASETGSSTVVVRGRPGLSAAEGQLELGRNQPATTPFGSGDPLGKILFTDNGSNVYSQVVCEADGTSASGDYPGRLVFSTTADGASSPSEAFRVTSQRQLRFSDASADPGGGSNIWQKSGLGLAMGGGQLAFYTGTTERMRITSTGEIWVGTSVVQRHNNINTGLWGYDPSGTGTLVFINRGTAGNGAYQGVSLGKAATSWGTYSDERGKTALVPIENGLSKISTLRAVTGRYIEEEKDVSRSFLIAQDVQAVLPEAVEADNPEKLNLRYTEVIPLLVAALKESKERIETLEAQNASLEARLTALEGGAS